MTWYLHVFTYSILFLLLSFQEHNMTFLVGGMSTYPSEKYESIGTMTFHTSVNIKHVPNHQPDLVTFGYIWLHYHCQYTNMGYNMLQSTLQDPKRASSAYKQPSSRVVV